MIQPFDVRRAAFEPSPGRSPIDDRDALREVQWLPLPGYDVLSLPEKLQTMRLQKLELTHLPMMCYEPRLSNCERRFAMMTYKEFVR